MTTCGIHPVDQAIWAFDTHLAGPIEIEREGRVGEGAFDALAKWEARISFPNGVRMIYKNADTHGWSDGADYTRFVGSEGMLHVTYGRGPMKAEPESLLTATLGPSDVRLAESNNHGGNFLDAVRTRAQPVAHIDDAFRADVLCRPTSPSASAERSAGIR